MKTLPAVRPVETGDRAEWLRMRRSLWPDSADEHAAEIERVLSGADRSLHVLVAEREGAGLLGFLEVGTRSHAEGCTTSPVAYLEGWWVDPDARRAGVGAALVAAAEGWARARGLREIASDAELSNAGSHAAHRALGYTEVDRIVCFRKRL